MCIPIVAANLLVTLNHARAFQHRGKSKHPCCWNYKDQDHSGDMGLSLGLMFALHSVCYVDCFVLVKAVLSCGRAVAEPETLNPRR